jgi:hypothetical protein
VLPISTKCDANSILWQSLLCIPVLIPTTVSRLVRFNWSGKASDSISDSWGMSEEETAQTKTNTLKTHFYLGDCSKHLEAKLLKSINYILIRHFIWLILPTLNPFQMNKEGKEHGERNFLHINHIILLRCSCYINKPYLTMC